MGTKEWALVLVALLASLAHLGRPLLALNALRNLSTSWLSREIFFSGGASAWVWSTRCP